MSTDNKERQAQIDLVSKYSECMDTMINETTKKINDMEESLKNFKKTKTDTYKNNDVCIKCCGSGVLYSKPNYSDPYEKSSDRKYDCPKCNGTGRWVD